MNTNKLWFGVAVAALVLWAASLDVLIEDESGRWCKNTVLSEVIHIVKWEPRECPPPGRRVNPWRRWGALQR